MRFNPKPNAVKQTFKIFSTVIYLIMKIIIIKLIFLRDQKSHQVFNFISYLTIIYY